MVYKILKRLFKLLWSEYLSKRYMTILVLPSDSTGKTRKITLPAWSAKAAREFELRYFNEGNYIRAVEDRIRSENLTRVLYPNDTTEMGRELRFEQEYFFVSSSLQDILYRFSKHHDSLDELPEKVKQSLDGLSKKCAEAKPSTVIEVYLVTLQYDADEQKWVWSPVKKKLYDLTPRQALMQIAEWRDRLIASADADDRGDPDLNPG